MFLTHMSLLQLRIELKQNTFNLMARCKKYVTLRSLKALIASVIMQWFYPKSCYQAFRIRAHEILFYDYFYLFEAKTICWIHSSIKR